VHICVYRYMKKKGNIKIKGIYGFVCSAGGFRPSRPMRRGHGGATTGRSGLPVRDIGGGNNVMAWTGVGLN
jgi:hypothetical protein